MGVQTIVLDPEGQMEKAVAAMEDLINKKVDGISVYTITPELDVRLANMAKEAEIPVHSKIPCPVKAQNTSRL
jgi:ABC-type sugar transport system substrate-binding protein